MRSLSMNLITSERLNVSRRLHSHFPRRVSRQLWKGGQYV